MFIYIVTNTANGKQYVGQTTVGVEVRWRSHLKAARSKAKMGCRVLCAAIKKYGPQAFSVEAIPLGETATQETLDIAERNTITRLGTMVPHGYNLRGGGDGGRLHEDTRQALSDITRRRFQNDGSRQRHGAAMKAAWQANPSALRTAARQQHSRNAASGSVSNEKQLAVMRERSSLAMRDPLRRQQLSEAAKKRFEDPEARQRQADRQRGKRHSPESRALMSAVHKLTGCAHLNTPEAKAKRQHLTAEHRAKIAQASKHRPRVSEETRVKMRLAAKCRPPITEDTRAKMRAAHIRNNEARAWAS